MVGNCTKCQDLIMAQGTPHVAVPESYGVQALSEAQCPETLEIIYLLQLHFKTR